jgi:hypothetical protein
MNTEEELNLAFAEYRNGPSSSPKKSRPNLPISDPAKFGIEYTVTNYRRTRAQRVANTNQPIEASKKTSLKSGAESLPRK